MKHFLALIILFVASFSYAQSSTVSWSFDAKKTAPNEYTIYLKGTIQAGWYVYSQYLESDEGPIPTAIILEENSAVSLKGEAGEKGQKVEGFDDMFGMNISKFKKEILLTQKVKISNSTTLKGYVTFMSCNDEQCLPPTDVPFELKLK